VFNVVYTHKIGDKTTYTLDMLYSFQRHFPGVGASGFVNDWGVVQYLTYQRTPTLGVAGRLEFFGDPQGPRTGTRSVYEEVTAGLVWKPRPWLLIRPEVRYDYSDGRAFEGNSPLFTAAFDFVVRW
jgi:hypothetical protein